MSEERLLQPAGVFSAQQRVTTAMAESDHPAGETHWWCAYQQMNGLQQETNVPPDWEARWDHQERGAYGFVHVPTGHPAKMPRAIASGPALNELGGLNQGNVL